MKSGISSGVIAGISVAAVSGLLIFAGCFYVVFYRKRQATKIELAPTTEDQSLQGSSRSSRYTLYIITLQSFMLPPMH